VLRRVRLEDAGLGLDHLSERPVRDALAVGKGSTLSPTRQSVFRVQPLEQLPHEPRLADPGDTDQRHELRLAVASNARERVQEHVELVHASNQRRPTDLPHVRAEPRSRLQRLPGADGLGLPFRGDRDLLAVLDRPLGRVERRLVDEDAVLGGGALEPRGSVDHVAGGHALP
jgi:hypothetical protein